MQAQWTSREWIQKLKANDPVVHDALWRNLHQWADIERHLHKYDVVITEQAAINSYAKLTQKIIYKLDIRISFEGYARTVLRRCIIDLLPPAPDVDKDEAWWSTQQSPQPEKRFASDVAYQHLKDCLETLSKGQLAVVTKRYIEGLSSRKVAALLGKKPNSIDQLSHDGKKRLRHCLEGKGFKHRDDFYG